MIKQIYKVVQVQLSDVKFLLSEKNIYLLQAGKNHFHGRATLVSVIKCAKKIKKNNVLRYLTLPKKKKLKPELRPKKVETREF